jgi:serine/threonine protein kinase/TolB-like protein/tetratricopeptide (TPR) repeat protein
LEVGEGHQLGPGFLDDLPEGTKQPQEAGSSPSEHAVAFGGRAAPSVPLTERIGDRIGCYKLLQQIGEGGCGVVYMAEQQEPIKRRVALKVIKLGMDTREVIARFEAERQALALMDHPHIAKVLDAGATEKGRPFFVMELVRGIKITDYCDQNNLSTRERLDLFAQVCQAVEHAHQKGIIHRDIKPSNILVTLHDDVPVPKVIDFGLAKATAGQTLTDKTLFTAFDQFVGTPAYTSPEQAVMSGLDIDARSDIYSLGVLLYELLTGRTSFEPRELQVAGLDEMRRIIREDEPPKPSTRLSTLDADEQTKVAKRRQSEPPKLIQLVRGDLDWIVMKCLEKDRNRRYKTASGLGADIRRHLNSEPVLARPPSNLYRLQKLVWRNTLGPGVGRSSLPLLMAAGMLLLTVGIWVVYHSAAPERITIAVLLLAALVAWIVFHRSGGFQSWGRIRNDSKVLPKSSGGPITSLAVLPFVNLSGDPNQEYFVDGITELLCIELGGVSALKKVTSRTTVMQYKGTAKKVPQIASELGVDAVVEGAVQRESNRVLLSIHLIDGRTDRHLWGSNYEREVSGLLKLKTDLARAITSEIMVQLTPEERSRFDTTKPTVPAALDAYLKGRFHYWSPAMHWPELQTAEDCYEQAITLDPACARAYAGLADVYVARMFHRGQRAKPWLAKAKESVQKALALDDCLAEAHTTAAWVKMMHDWDWPGAEREVRRAIQLNPSYSQAHTWYGHMLSALGRFDEASIEMKRGQELDPLSPRSYIAVPDPAYLSGNYTQALETAQKLLSSSASSLYAHFIIAKVYLQQGKFQESIAESLKLPDRFWEIELDPILPRAYALSGRRGEALKALEQFKAVSQTDAPPAYSIASICTALGDYDQAFRWLDQAYEDCSGPIFKLGVDPAFRPLHPDPRFDALLKKMNLRR